MMTPSLLILVALLLILGYKAKKRNDGSIMRAYERFKQQIAQFLPRMVLVVIGTGFLLQVIPADLISTYLGKDAGWLPVLYGGFAGMLVPAGPAVAFTTAATLASSGAAPAAMVAFITAWCIFAIHRILIYETHLAGPRFLMVRCVVAAPIPFIAGFLTHLVTNI
ncbi:MAG TPA: hypothetical protein DEF72_07525 [Gammaproteobacteria bacterium]|nr:hypothetical protein [Gammaproteobacteria bacterium]